MAWIQNFIMDSSQRYSVKSFYMVLPSNGCEKTRPNNEASSFIIDFENAVEFQKKWEVALTEFSFNTFHQYIHLDMKLKFNIEKPMEEIISVQVKKGVLYLNGKTLEFPIVFKHFTLTKSADNQLQIKPDASPIELKFFDNMAPHTFGLKSQTYFGEFITGANGLSGMLDFKTKMSITVDKKDIYRDEITFEKMPLFKNSDGACEYLRTHCERLFEKISLDQNGKISFTLKSNVSKLTINENLARYLGFKTLSFTNNIDKSYEFKAEAFPSLAKPFVQVYIYNSISEPLLVADSKVPLLKSIWVEAKHDIGDVIYENMDHPMYLPVASQTINNIEIELRTDSGDLVEFPYGSKTSLTLHFREIQ